MDLNLTPETLLSGAGIAVAAAAIRQIIQIVKSAAPFLDANLSGVWMAVALSALLYIGVFAGLAVHDFTTAMGAILSWIACATAAVGIHAAAEHVTTATAQGAAVAGVPLPQLAVADPTPPLSSVDPSLDNGGVPLDGGGNTAAPPPADEAPIDTASVLDDGFIDASGPGSPDVTTATEVPLVNPAPQLDEASIKAIAAEVVSLINTKP